MIPWQPTPRGFLQVFDEANNRFERSEIPMMNTRIEA
jgi:hypothetical protein